MTDPALEALPDFSTHPCYRRLYDALTPGAQNREQATLLLANVWHPRHLQEGGQQQRPVKLEQGEPRQPDYAQQPRHLHAPHQRPPPNHGDQHHGHAPRPFPLGPPLTPQELPPRQAEDQGWFAPDKADKQTLQMPPIDMKAQSRTMFLRRPTTYALEKFRGFEYVPLWYFTDEGRQAADEDEGSNEDLWDVTEISDDCLSLHIVSSNPPSSDELSDEQLT